MTHALFTRIPTRLFKIFFVTLTVKTQVFAIDNWSENGFFHLFTKTEVKKSRTEVKKSRTEMKSIVVCDNEGPTLPSVQPCIETSNKLNNTTTEQLSTLIPFNEISVIDSAIFFKITNSINTQISKSSHLDFSYAYAWLMPFPPQLSIANTCDFTVSVAKNIIQNKRWELAFPLGVQCSQSHSLRSCDTRLH